MRSRSFRSRFLQLSLVLTTVVVAPSIAQESRAADNQVIARAEAVRRPATVDCRKIKAPKKSRQSRPRVTDSLVQVGAPLKLNNEGAPDILTAGVWSPSGDSIAFVAFSGRWVQMNQAEDSATQADTQDAPTRAVARSVNEIWLYQFQDKAWNKVTDDGARPRFSKDGKRLFYLSGEGARAVNLATMAEESLGVPQAGDPHKRFQTEILSDGTVLSTGESDNVLKQRNALSSTWASMELAPNDEVRVAPDEQHIAVLYNATEDNPNSALVVYDRAGTATTVLKNCPVPAIYSTWSQDGNSLIYPMTAAGQPEVWETKLSGGSPLTRVRLQPSERINDVSLSSDNEYVAFSQISHSGRGWIWIANDKGMQRVTAGVLGKWSLQGDRILYATMRAQGEFDWYVVPVTVQSK